MHTLQSKNITHSIQQKKIINGISLTIDNQSITGFLGPNGAGKTTFFHILAGLIQADAGKVFINDQNISNLPTHKRLICGIAFLPQNSSIFQQMSVENNILSGLDYNTRLPYRKKIKLLEQSLDQFKLHAIRKSLGITLSGGERRRTELARCLIMQPKFILLDEPFSGIDPITVKETQQILKEIIKTGTGILISDHNATDTIAICNSIYLLHQGTILAHDSPKNIMKNQLAQSCYFGDQP